MTLMSSRLVAAVVALAVLAASAGPGRSAEKIKITIAAHSAPFAPLYHAQASGYFAEEGLDVDIVVTPGPGAVQAVLARDAQFTVAVGTYQIAAYERGQPLLALMSILTRNSVNVVTHKEAARAKGISEKSSLADKIRALKGSTSLSPSSDSRTTRALPRGNPTMRASVTSWPFDMSSRSGPAWSEAVAHLPEFRRETT